MAKVASGEFDIGFGDFSALIEHAAKNPTAPAPIAVYMLYERTPAALFIRKASGANRPEDLAGKKLGAPPFALKAALKDTREAVKLVKELDPTADEQFEWRRARLAFDTFVNTPTVQEAGLGFIDMKRVQSNIDLVTTACKLNSKPQAVSIARADFLPSAKDRWQACAFRRWALCCPSGFCYGF